MGWWGFNVMEGDPPMDGASFLDMKLSGITIDEACDGVTYTEMVDKREAKAIEAIMTGQYFDTIAAILIGECEYCDGTILMQVLGEMIMVHGGPMPENVRALIIKAAQDDEWAQTTLDREVAMQAYIKRVEGYNGTALEPMSRGLIDTINAAQNEGTIGLVNK